MEFMMGNNNEVFVTPKHWLVKKSFPIVVFVCPLLLLYSIFLFLTSTEVLNTKPSLSLLIVGIGGAIVGWIILVMIFSIIWTFIIRLLFNSTQAREWIYDEKPIFGRIGNTLEIFFRKICEIALK
jgi:hypothetical protein